MIYTPKVKIQVVKNAITYSNCLKIEYCVYIQFNIQKCTLIAENA